MRIRAVDENGDIVFGQPNDYEVNTLQGMALFLRDRLNLWLGTWFADTQDGVPYLQQILGNNNTLFVTALIQERILNTAWVNEIKSLYVEFNEQTGKLTIQGIVSCTLGDVTLNETIS